MLSLFHGNLPTNTQAALNTDVTVTPSVTPDVTDTPTPTDTIEPTETITPTVTPVATDTPTVTPTETVTPTITPTDTPAPSVTPEGDGDKDDMLNVSANIHALFGLMNAAFHHEQNEERFGAKHGVSEKGE